MSQTSKGVIMRKWRKGFPLLLLVLCAAAALVQLPSTVLAARGNIATLSFLVSMDGAPVPGAVVSVVDSSGDTRVAVTDSSGVAVIAFRVPGNHVELLTFWAFSGTDASEARQLSLRAGDDVWESLELRRGIPLQDISF